MSAGLRVCVQCSACKGRSAEFVAMWLCVCLQQQLECAAQCLYHAGNTSFHKNTLSICRLNQHSKIGFHAMAMHAKKRKKVQRLHFRLLFSFPSSHHGSPTSNQVCSCSAAHSVLCRTCLLLELWPGVFEVFLHTQASPTSQLSEFV